VAAEFAGDLQHQSHIGAAVVGADEGRVLQWEIGVVVPGEDNDAILLAWKLGDYVVPVVSG
jgi:hypothetical protein